MRKSISLFAFLLVFVTLLSAKDLTTTKEGGNWNDTKTWVDGILPSISDDVVILGKVTVTENTEVQIITLMAGSELIILKDITLKASEIKRNGEYSIINNGIIEVGKATETKAIETIDKK